MVLKLSSAYRKSMSVTDWSFWHQMRKLYRTSSNYLIVKWSQASELEEESRLAVANCPLRLVPWTLSGWMNLSIFSIFLCRLLHSCQPELHTSHDQQPYTCTDVIVTVTMLGHVLSRKKVRKGWDRANVNRVILRSWNELLWPPKWTRLAQSTAAISQHRKALHLSPSLLIRKLASLALTAFHFEPHSTNVKLPRLILREILFLAITYVTQSEGKHNCLCIFTAHTIASWGCSWGSTIRVLNLVRPQADFNMEPLIRAFISTLHVDLFTHLPSGTVHCLWHTGPWKQT